MRYLPHTDDDISTMLRVTGVDSIDDFFAVVPEDLRRPSGMALPDALTEWELNDLMATLSNANTGTTGFLSFMGAGSYDHYIPETVPFLAGRSEFATSYTPYQPELSQGTLQAIYEYQTLVARLTGMEIANASMYDGASALAEAILMALRITKKTTVAVSAAVHPFYRQVIRTYVEPTGCSVRELPVLESGRTDLSTLESSVDCAVAALQSPNFFGCVENLPTAARIIHDQGGLLAASFTEPLAFGLYRPPGVDGADIACGEGQSLGIPRSFGGPGVGIFCTRSRYVRSMPGRLVGKTRDQSGKRGFVLTLATREQHIRRERATSNICTNSSLCALSSAVYLASLGGSGLRRLARLNYDKTEYLKRNLSEAGWTVPFTSPTFNEFVARIPGDAEEAHRGLREKGILAGVPLGRWYPDLRDCLLLCVTETATREDMDRLVSEVRS
jgi:glycine dehydrogenase subunit 1